MEKNTIVVGLDVHKKTVVAAVLPPRAARATEVVTFENTPAAIEQRVRRWALQGRLEFVYEAGPCGYEIQRQLTTSGYTCVVIAPGLTPVRPGDRVKTDRRDAEKLARFHRAGELTPIRIPTREEEAARDLVRVREDLLGNRLAARHRLAKFLLRQGRVYQETKAWGVAHQAWLRSQAFAWPVLSQTFAANVRTWEETEAHLHTVDQQVQEVAQLVPYRALVQALRCLKGVDTLTAVTLAVEAQEFRRFGGARDFMSYAGLVVSERTSGERSQRGSITKAGNAHLRRVLVEAAWHARHRQGVGPALAARREGCPPVIVHIAKKAQDRLHRKYWRLVSRSKEPQKAVVAVARELAGFVWAIAQHVPEAARA